MLIKIRGAFKGFSTILTFVGSLFSMNSLMYDELRIWIEVLSAVLTRVVFLSNMNFLVLVSFRESGKGPGTNSAGKDSLLHVNFLMPSQAGFLADMELLVHIKGREEPEGPLAHITSVWFPSTVHVLMLHQLGSSVKGSATLATFKVLI